MCLGTLRCAAHAPYSCISARVSATALPEQFRGDLRCTHESFPRLPPRSRHVPVGVTRQGKSFRRPVQCQAHPFGSHPQLGGPGSDETSHSACPKQTAMKVGLWPGCRCTRKSAVRRAPRTAGFGQGNRERQDPESTHLRHSPPQILRREAVAQAAVALKLTSRWCAAASSAFFHRCRQRWRQRWRQPQRGRGVPARRRGPTT
jgi:hypothetical protein